MKKDDLVSEEQLNAFTDGELDAEEENRIFELAEQSSELDARLCRQRKLKELVQHAYRDVPRPRRHGVGAVTRGRGLGAAFAAMLLLAAGFAGGFFGTQLFWPDRAGPEVARGAEALAQAQPASYLLHVTSADPERMHDALHRATELMQEPDGGPGRQVEIVANEGGLNLLRSDITPYAAEIRELAERNVLFFACTRAIERLESQGIEVVLLPEANADFSALDRVVLRMQQGWEYVKI